MNLFEDMELAMSHISDLGSFLTVKSADGRVNTMTTGWGFIGRCLRKPCFITMVRNHRYTHDLLETADSYTISIPFGNKMEQALKFCGTNSGRGCNKASLAGIEYMPAREVSSPVVAGCDMYYECKIEYVETMNPGKFPADISKSLYNEKDDYHDMFLGEIVTVYKSEK